MIPQNEMGVVVLFAQRASEAGITILEIGTSFPDAKIEKDGKEYLVEFEYESSNFFIHGHDIRQCDLIICWRHTSTLVDLPVIELSNDNWLSTEIRLFSETEKELTYWKHRARSAELRLMALISGDEINKEIDPDGCAQAKIFAELDKNSTLGPREMSRRVRCAPSTAKTHIDRWKALNGQVTK